MECTLGCIWPHGQILWRDLLLLCQYKFPHIQILLKIYEYLIIFFYNYIWLQVPRKTWHLFYSHVCTEFFVHSFELSPIIKPKLFLSRVGDKPSFVQESLAPLCCWCLIQLFLFKLSCNRINFGHNVDLIIPSSFNFYYCNTL